MCRFGHHAQGQKDILQGYHLRIEFIRCDRWFQFAWKKAYFFEVNQTYLFTLLWFNFNSQSNLILNNQRYRRIIREESFVSDPTEGSSNVKKHWPLDHWYGYIIRDGGGVSYKPCILEVNHLEGVGGWCPTSSTTHMTCSVKDRFIPAYKSVFSRSRFDSK